MTGIARRSFLRQLAGSTISVVASQAFAATPTTKRPNILFITADDMNYDSLGVTGCKAPGITPNLDRLAAEGIRFKHAHITCAVCQPSRSVLMTGRYPHRNGAVGFNDIRLDVPTLQESLAAAGYINGILAKVEHLTPLKKFCWDTVVGAAELQNGRSPKVYYQNTKQFIEKARAAGKPFFLMANSQDPHRPFAGSEPPQKGKQVAKKKAIAAAGVSQTYKPEEVEVPGFLPDLPAVRKEIAQYYTSVHRCDETVGEILRALKESGLEDDTLVMFLSDNGMAFPFAKTNCYLNSTATPWIVRWPGKTKGGRVDNVNFISGIDFMPTILDAAGLEQVKDMDGRSFLPLLLGEKQEGRDMVYTVFHETSARKEYLMRCIQNAKYGYIYNPWSDGKTIFRNESQSGLTFAAMQEAAKTDEKIAARVKMFLYRTPEEFYDFEADPCALKNLIDDPKHAPEIAKMRKAMLEKMTSIADPLAEPFKRQVKME
jgi:N-sulfoglucosamine sulfohydrolase